MNDKPLLTGKGSAYHTTGARVLGGRRCPNCGELAPTHASVCPACGEGLKARAAMIRCRRCGRHAPSELALCPYCGRELAPAPARLLTWGVPSLLVALFLILVAGQLNGRNPIAWSRAGLSRVALGNGGQANRGIVVVMTPVPAGEMEASVEPGMVQIAVVNPEEESVAAPVEPEQAEAAPVEPEVAPVEPEAAPVEPETAPAEAAASGEVAPLPTATTSATEESAPKTEEAQVMAAGAVGSSPADLALPTATPTQEPLPTLTSAPPATPAPTDTPTQTPAPMPTYQIRKGDTLIMVARRHDVLLEDLMSANDLDSQEAFTIQPGQILVIPVNGLTPPVTPPVTPTPLPTLAPTDTPVASPAPTSTPVPKTTFRLDAPALRSPESGAPLSCAEPTSLVWASIPFMRPTDKYVLHLGFVNGRTDDNRDIVVWIMEQPRPANATSWDMDASLCSVAPQEFGRQWRWYVEAAEEAGGKLVPVSPPSAIWTFSWN